MKNLVQKLFIALVLLIGLRQAAAQGTAFTYQGRLNSNSVPLNGLYDMAFTLSNAPSGGSQVGSSITNTGVGVTNGLFTVTLNFGAVFTGNSTWLAISVRSNGVGSFVGLTPPQELNPTPYSIFANTASNLSGTLSPGNLSGTYPDAVTLNNAANVFIGNGNGLTDLNAANLTGTIADALLPADVALLDAANQTFTGSNIFTGGGHSFILNTGATIATNLFTGLSLQYQPAQGEAAFQSSYNDGYSSISFWTKQGNSFPIDRQVFIDRYGAVIMDYQNANSGVFNSGTTNGVGLVFGSSSGEGIASARQLSGNQFGLDFYTDFIDRMSVTHSGFVGIGTTNPTTALQVNGTVTATGFAGPIALSQLPSTVVVENENGVTLDNMIIAGTLDLPFPASIQAAGADLLRADGNYNFFAGFDAGNTSLTGYGNTGIGTFSSQNFTTGSYNAASGFYSLEANSVGSYNTANGAFALEYNSTGSNNTAMGSYALSAAFTGPDLTGSGNTAVGGYALANDNPGYNNTGVGFQALQNNTNGFDNVAVGVAALQYLNDGAGNFLNTAIGTYSMPSTTYGYYNTGLGAYSLYSLTNGAFNLAMGLDAGYYLVSGSDNIYIGSYGSQGDSYVTRIGEFQTDTYISSWNGSFNNGVLSMEQGDTNNGIVEIANTANFPLGGTFGGTGTFVYGFDGGALGTVGPNEVSLAWNYLGNVWCSNNFSTLSLTIRGGSDLAEPFKITPGTGEIPDGSVVVIDEVNPGRLKLSSEAYDTRVAGILSGANGVHPGIQMQQQGLMEGDRNVALTGRVYVQADASNGPIKPGDLLTTSSTPGRAMKVTDHTRAQGAILGKAMSSLSEGNGMVLVLVSLQ